MNPASLASIPRMRAILFPIAILTWIVKLTLWVETRQGRRLADALRESLFLQRSHVSKNYF